MFLVFVFNLALAFARDDCPCIDMVGEIVPKVGFDSSNGKCKNGKVSFIQGYFEAQGTLIAGSAGVAVDDQTGVDYYSRYAGIRSTLPVMEPYDKIGVHAAFEGTPEQVAAKINVMFNEKHKISTSDARILQGFHKILNAGSCSKAEAYAATLQSYSVEERLKIGQLLGYRGYNSYDSLRAKGEGPAAGKQVSCDEVLQSNSYNTDKGYFYQNTVDSSPDAKYGANCDEIAAAQARFYRAMGFKQAYVLSYGYGGLGTHAVVAIADPEHKGRLHSISGGHRITVNNREGGDALFQGDSDASIRYDLGDPSGKTKIVLDSTLAKDLRKLAGFHMDKFDPLAPNNSILVRGGVSVGESGSTSLGVGASHNVNGQTVVGATFSQTIPEGKYFKTQIGVVGGFLRNPVGAGGPEGASQLAIVYVSAEQEAKTPCVRLASDKLCGRIEGSLVVSSLVTLGLSGASKAVGAPSFEQFDAKLRGGFVAEFIDSKTAHRSWLGCEGTLGYSEIGKSVFSSPSPVLNKCALMNESGMSIGTVQVFAGSTLLYYPGTGSWVGQVKTGIGVGKFRGAAGIQGPLTQDTPAFIPGSMPLLFVEGSQAIGVHPVILFIRVSQALQSSDDGKAPTTATSGLKANF